MSHPIKLNQTVATFLNELGPIFDSFLTQDSGNKSYSIHTAHGPKWIKILDLDRTPIHDLQATIRFYNSLQHPAIPKNWQLLELNDGMALMSDWVPGQVLGSPNENRQDADSTYQRFIRLPIAKRLKVFTTILDLFIEIEAQNIIVEDFYDGSIIYDFAQDDVYICDLDHIYQGSYQLQKERQFGSRRFMAPEEFRQGNLIDSRTNVFTMGATGFVLLNDNRRKLEDWTLPVELHQILQKAIAERPNDRFDNIATLYQTWQAATASC
ncbi:MAG: serine/threonine-protein kinase [Chloroflexota bacterium]